jgi:hypothetical protein
LRLEPVFTVVVAGGLASLFCNVAAGSRSYKAIIYKAIIYKAIIYKASPAKLVPAKMLLQNAPSKAFL